MGSMKKFTCRVLVVSTLMLSFTTAKAGLIGVEQAAANTAPTERAMVLAALDRAEVSGQLLAAGVDPNAARARVNAMTDTEVQAMVQDMQNAPAGAMSGWGWAAVIIVIGLIWYMSMRK
ncbi:PA2779 family protein [Ramlibacter albus]|uniref:PA2779 family protein n=1 Tax=Ramlibacter albus TaxID=2079448 RepID=A0A923S4A4_9BURK|nr:PA2779 family protein [Ramlibacter albus]MBC5767389.1 PA2779 family protein [Ramlibacter albus]